MSELSLGFLTLLGLETAILMALSQREWRRGESLTLRTSAHIWNVLIASTVLNSVYLLIWFMHLQVQEVLK